MNVQNRIIRMSLWFPLLGIVLSVAFANSPCSGFQTATKDTGAVTKDTGAETQDTDVETKPDQNASPINHVQKSDFLRLQTDEYENPIALQTATTKYVLKNENGEIEFEVFLESVIHIADTSYYRGFQQRFKQYDSVLYESMAPPEMRKANQPAKSSGINMLQQLSSGTLGLAYQFDEVDFKVGNLKHADLSAGEISALMKERGDNEVTLFADLLSHIIKKIKSSALPGAPTDSKTDAPLAKPRKSISLDLKVFTDPNGIMKIRRLMASALVDSKLLESVFPPSVHQMMIGDRNDRAMGILDAERKNGKQRIALFFGVGHMADFEKRLVTKYGMTRDSTNWRNAWDLRDGAIEGAPLEGLVESAFRDSFKNKMRNFARGLRNKDSGDDSNSKRESEKSKKIDDLEKTLKALEAKLKSMEKQGGGKNE